MKTPNRQSDLKVNGVSTIADIGGFFMRWLNTVYVSATLYFVIYHKPYSTLLALAVCSTCYIHVSWNLFSSNSMAQRKEYTRLVFGRSQVWITLKIKNFSLFLVHDMINSSTPFNNIAIWELQIRKEESSDHAGSLMRHRTTTNNNSLYWLF